MRTWLLSAMAALGIGLGATASDASAAWVYQTAYRWDPVCRQYVPVPERVWVPDGVHYRHHHHAHHHFHRR